jgi:hypothetical protein
MISASPGGVSSIKPANSDESILPIKDEMP